MPSHEPWTCWSVVSSLIACVVFAGRDEWSRTTDIAVAVVGCNMGLGRDSDDELMERIETLESESRIWRLFGFVALILAAINFLFTNMAWSQIEFNRRAWMDVGSSDIPGRIAVNGKTSRTIITGDSIAIGSALEPDEEWIVDEKGEGTVITTPAPPSPFEISIGPDHSVEPPVLAIKVRQGDASQEWQLDISKPEPVLRPKQP